MFIKLFKAQQVRVPDPLRPGKRTFEERLIPAGAPSGVLSVQGTNYTADEEGWFDLPGEIAASLLTVRYPGGERFHTPADVNEQIGLGALPAEEAPNAPKRRNAR